MVVDVGGVVGLLLDDGLTRFASASCVLGVEAGWALVFVGLGWGEAEFLLGGI